MNQFRLIEPYLRGTLSPEEQLFFERQLTLNPALAQELTLRFSLVRVLLANPDYPFHAALKTFDKKVRASTGLPKWIWHACSVGMLVGLFFGLALP